MVKAQKDWNWVNTAVFSLTKCMHDEQYRPDLIVGITRGGLIPGVMLSHEMNIPFETLEWSHRDSGNLDYPKISNIVNTQKKILFVEDIVDSGITMHSLIVHIVSAFPNFTTYKFASLIQNTDITPWANFSYEKISRKTNQDWFVFPWERI